MRYTIASLVALASAASAQVYQGFNYGSTFTNGAAKQQSDFEAEFTAAQGLVGHSGFTSARLYTMIQAGTAGSSNQPISAIPAAISTKTTLLLGLWASAGQAGIDQEIAALNTAIKQYGSAFTDLIAGISVGSEDLYRITPTGIANKAGVGAQPDEVASYLNQVRNNVSSTVKAPIGHVDTWTAWVNGSNSAVVDASDFLGVDAYPYFQTVNANGIENGASLFFEAYQNTVNSAKGKPVWVTESGWPVSGPQENAAVASPQNAKTYWDAVACKLLGKTNTWWYTLQDAEPDTPSPSFGLVAAGPLGANPQPIYDLSCSADSSSSASPSPSSATPSSTPSVGSSAPPVTTPVGSAPVPGSGTTFITGTDGTITVRSTSWSTVTACPTAASSDATITVLSTAYVTACPECDKTSVPPVISSQGPTTPISSGTPAPAPSPSATSSACPADLKGEYQYPHLIVPVDKNQPDKAEGTSYFGYVNSTTSTIFNFDIPQSYAGKTCTLVFLFPEKSQLETSDYTLAGAGGLTFTALSSPATQQTTYNNQPKAVGTVGTVSSLTPGNSYTITSESCPAGSAIAYEISATGGVNLSYFQDWNPSPLGLFIRTC